MGCRGGRVETIKDVDPETVTIEDAMTPEPYCVGPRASLRTVAAEMAAKKLGSAIVLQRGRVIGIFTTTDALRALSESVQRPARANASNSSEHPGPR